MAKKLENNQSKKVLTKESMIEAYLKIAFFEGFDRVTLQRISQEAEVAFGTVRNYFSDPNPNLFQASRQYVSEKVYTFFEDFVFEKRKNKKFNPIHVYIDANFEWIKKYPYHTSFWVYCIQLSTSKSPDKVDGNSFLERPWLRVEAFLNESIGRKIYPEVSNTIKLSKTIHSTLLGFWISHQMLNSKSDFQIQSKEVIDTLIKNDLSISK